MSIEHTSEFKRFFEQLTYKTWRPDDFGTPPSDTERFLLKSHAPRFWVSKRACLPLDFYKQYAPLLFQKMEDGNDIQANRVTLKLNERNFKIAWERRSKPECLQSENPPLYAYAWTETRVLPNGKKEPIRILKYSFSFDKSGLPAKLSLWQKAIRLLGNPSHWHHLDIHGAVFYLLNSKSKVFGVVLAQHNHFRSYVIDRDVSENDARRICFAIRSNEPYLCGPDAGPYAFATAPSFQKMTWIVTQRNKPLSGAWDLIPTPKDRQRIRYHLEFLTSKDPLITSWVAFGPELKIWGIFSTFFRKSPPGMAIFNLPDLKELWKTAQYYYFSPDDLKTLELHEDNSEYFFKTNVAPVFKINSLRYQQALDGRR